MSYQEASLLEPKAQRRPSKYTPERIQQIKDLLTRGETCEQIAAIIGVTVGSLRVTCSKLGVSLRRPRVKLLPPRTADSAGEAATLSIIMKYKGQERNTPLSLTPNIIRQLAFEAALRDQEIGEFTKDLLASVIEKGLFNELLGE